MKKQTLYRLICLLIALCCAFLFFLPLPTCYEGGKEWYDCSWEDGSVSRESYVSALSAYSYMTDREIGLKKEGKEGKIAVGARAKSLYVALSSAPLAELLRLNATGISRIEQYALLSTYGNGCYYDGDKFSWQGDRFARTSLRQFESVSLLSGEVPQSVLVASEAKLLRLYAQSRISGNTLVDSKIERVEAFSPYESSGNAIYRVGVDRRLIAALPFVEDFTADCDFIDQNAFAACTSLVRLTLPFCGNSSLANSEAFCGDLGALFQMDENGEYVVPDSLKEIQITGGVVTASAFYRLNGVEELTLCGMKGENVSATAFEGLVKLKLLHTPKEVLLTGGFVKTELECGCVLYLRK